MKKNLLTRLAVCLLGLAAFAYTAGSQEEPSPTPVPGAPGAQHHGGHHPAIRAAIGALERAKAEMQAAAHDFGGHRVDALAACDAAIAQLRLALQYANQNNGAAPTPTP
jgi:hypothetical protein